MPVIDLKIGNLSLQIEADDHKKILELAEEVNAKINSLKTSLKGITDIKAVLITTLMLQDEIHKATDSAKIQAKSLASEQIEELEFSFYNLLNHVSDKIEELSSDLQK